MIVESILKSKWMKMNNKLDKIFKNSKELVIDDNTKLVIMSDCHRGAGNNYDNFIKNKNIFEVALQDYYNKGFTYIELGDGDEMWEIEDYEDIIETHLDAFKQLKKFNDSGKLIMIYGNHDIVKNSPKILKKYFYKYYGKEKEKEKSLLDNLIVYESLILKYKNYDIFLIHGHQVDFLNSTIWPFSRFLVRHIWKPLEQLGIKDPTSAAKNYKVTQKTEKRLKNWSIKNNKILIAGHTHRPIFPQIGKSLYFNDGSCIHPNGITCIEIESGNITLVKWVLKANKNKLISVKRKVLDGNKPIINFFNNTK